MTEHTGGCACGEIRYRVAGPLRPVIACHCETCRRMSGHFTAATACRRPAISIEGEDRLRWWESSPWHRRGFCPGCGALLFWDRAGAPSLTIFAGSLDRPTGLALAGHIFTAEAGDYYALDDGLPQAPGADPALTTAFGDDA